ncbi:hypothetical protein MCOR34_009805 [Pyricularia oryzae]|nr:hypothetical protein MCOR34_009805 [Pyricularia oryzae]
MTDRSRSEIIRDNPIGNGLAAFHASFYSICDEKEVPRTPDAVGQLDQEDFQTIVLLLFSTLQILPASRLLRSGGTGKNVLGDIARLNSAVASDDFDLDRIKPLLRAALADDPNDALIWDQVYRVVAKSTPPPRLVPSVLSSFQQTPWLHNTGSFANSSEYRQDVDRVLRSELGPLYVGLPGARDVFFGRVAGLHAASEAVLKKCTEGDNPLFGSEGWRGWPLDAKENDVLAWFDDIIPKLDAFAETYRPTPTRERKLDIGLVDNPEAGKDSKYYWSHILVPGKLKSNRSADKASKAWLDLGSEEELGFDLTVVTAEGQRFIVIERDGRTERFIIDELMTRVPCVAGRATTCWKAHREKDPKTKLVIKDLWQYTERENEGDLFQEVTEKGVVNVARYYHHETVQVHGTDDDIRSNVRGGLDITAATNYWPERSMPLPNTIVFGASRKGRSSSGTAGKKRLSSRIGATLPPSKRSCSASPTKVSGDGLSNRVHRRIILRNYGNPIYKASSRSALLAALEGCIQGHESLLKAGFLYRDISINNLIINEDDNLCWPSFLIDLDLAVRETRKGASGAKGKTGTRAFMAIGALLGEQHSFMHDLESFFWWTLCTTPGFAWLVEWSGDSQGRSGGAAEDTTADLITDIPAAKVCELLLAALRCQERKHDENGWNQAVHYRLLRLALPADGFVDFEPCTTARITPEILPRSSSSGKKVDYCFIINGASVFHEPAMEAANRIGIWKTPAQTIEILRRRTPGTSINHTDFGPLNKWPIALSVETKRPGESGEKAELQVGVWQAAQWRLLEWQRQEQKHKLQIPQHSRQSLAAMDVEDETVEGAAVVGVMDPNTAGITTPSQTSIPPTTPDLVFLPALIIVGHDWKFAATTREDCDGGRTVLWTESTVGSTSNLLGIYRIIWCVRRLARYVEERHWPWYAEYILGLRLKT